jgi:hypothetical protein
VGVREAANAAIYIDGTLVQRGAIPSGLNVDAAFPIRLGGRFNGSGGAAAYTGDLDELRIYNRALSLAEIQALYSMNNPACTAMPAGVVAWWPGENDPGDIIKRHQWDTPKWSLLRARESWKRIRIRR